MTFSVRVLQRANETEKLRDSACDSDITPNSRASSGCRYIRSCEAHLQFMSLPGINPERTTLKVGKRLSYLTDTM